MPAVTPTVSPFVILLMLALMAAVVGAWCWFIVRLALGASVLPRFEPRIVPWGGGSVLAVMLMWVALQVLGQIVFVLATHGQQQPPKNGTTRLSPSEMMVASALQNTLILIVIPLALALSSRARPRDFGLDGPGRRTLQLILQGVVAWPLAVPVVYGMMIAALAIWTRQSHPLETAIQQEGVGRMTMIFFLAGAVLAPAAEELLFRGVLLGWLTRLVLIADSTAPPMESTEPKASSILRQDTGDQRKDEIGSDSELFVINSESTTSFAPISNPIPFANRTHQIRLAIANIIVSVLFAGLHYAVWPTPVPIFFLSLILGVLYQRTGSLVGPIALHMTFNGVSTVLMLMTIGMGFKVDPTNKPQNPIANPLPITQPRQISPPPGMNLNVELMRQIIPNCNSTRLT